MKYTLYIFILIALFACEKVKDHYRISGVTIKIGNISKGANDQCIMIGNKSDSLFNDIIAIQIEFIREYYSTSSSKRQGIMYSPIGWKGCKEKIIQMSLRSSKYSLNKLLFCDSTITGVGRDKVNWGHCQEKFGCECRNSLSISSIDSLMSLFNNQHKTKTRVFISEKYDKTPFVFLIRKKEVQYLKGNRIKIKLVLSNGKIIEAQSNKIEL